MIDELRQAVVDEIRSLYPTGYTIYEDDVPQHFKKPAFLLSVADHAYGKELGNVYKGAVLMDIAYFSAADAPNVETDCLGVQEALLREITQSGAFHALTPDAKITDKVLHITFTAKYRERADETDVPMQKIASQTTTLKFEE